jgi:hypothetical protein
MADAALLAIQDGQHRQLGGACLGLEQVIVTVAAVKPLGVLPMRKPDDRHAALQVEQDIGIVDPNLGVGADTRAWIDFPLLQRLNPAHHIPGVIRRQFGQGGGGFLQFLHRGAAGIMYAIPAQRVPGLGRRHNAGDRTG